MKSNVGSRSHPATGKRIFAACILCSIVCLCFCAGCAAGKDAPSTYTFPPDLCIAMFGCEPHEFNRATGIFMVFADFDVDGYVDEAGNLVFTLTGEQKQEIRENCLRTIEQMRELGGDISEDYTVYLLDWDIYLANGTFACQTHNACLFIQLIETGDPAKVSLEWHIYQYETGDTFMHTFWPEHYVNIDMVW